MLGGWRSGVVMVMVAGVSGATPAWMDPSDPPDVRAKALLAEMTFDEKVQMLHGPIAPMPCCECHNASGIIDKACAYTGNIAPNSRLGIPPVNMNDGPQGFREAIFPGTTTAWPSGLTVASSWDVNVMGQWGDGMGKEFFAKGANVQLGPGVCLARVPRNGRNFEYLSGEDPFLGYVLVQPVIKGIQSHNVVANAKHYVQNNQETDRSAISELVDERTRFEMYYPVFEGAVKAGVGSMMCSYNKINGVWSCENPTTLGDLKNSLGFKGYVMSDWGATHSTSIHAGLDVEMPSAKFMGPAGINSTLQAKGATLADIDDSVTRILTAMFQVGVIDTFAKDPMAYDVSKHSKNVTTIAAAELARTLSAQSTVLLKNDDALLPIAHGKRIAIIGLADTDNALTHAGGSGQVTPSFIATPLSSFKAAYHGGVVTYCNGSDVALCAAHAGAADVAIVFAGTLSSEGSDRKSLSLDDGIAVNNQNELITRVAAAQTNTAVVLSVPGAILCPWAPAVKAILTNFMPGQQAGNAITDVLLGLVNPSAKLPLTFPNVENETEFTPEQWPGLPDAPLPSPKTNPRQLCEKLTQQGFAEGFVQGPTTNDPPPSCNYANYTERLLVGYRYYDHHKIAFTTGFPFGHGLSYTQFAYSELTASKTAVSFTLKNTGDRAGAEVAQLYLGFPASAEEPPRQLKGFSKVLLAAGASMQITIPLTPREMSIWDVGSHGWQVVNGEFTAWVGSSSRDTRLTGTFTV
eukprot:m.371512 g.371512  ORF g.371512 m.371512 type:complete len:746 (+) comp28131_c0_seq1:2254-4491(+)